jgi:hypothetical protein
MGVAWRSNMGGEGRSEWSHEWFRSCNHLTSISYSWEHPQDGPQDGLLVVGSAGADDSLMAIWSDSWHQQPIPMSLSGSHGAGATVELEGDYGGGWGWRIVIDASDPENLRMRMDNVVPPDQASGDVPAGPYPVMVMNIRRT